MPRREIVGIQIHEPADLRRRSRHHGRHSRSSVAVAAGDTDPLAVHLPLVPLRCDPHAVQEDKRGTVFTLEVEVDGEPGEIELAASEDMRGQHPHLGRELVRIRLGLTPARPAAVAAIRAPATQLAHPFCGASPRDLLWTHGNGLTPHVRSY